VQALVELAYFGAIHFGPFFGPDPAVSSFIPPHGFLYCGSTSIQLNTIMLFDAIAA
jgi:hypothetical protein